MKFNSIITLVLMALLLPHCSNHVTSKSLLPEVQLYTGSSEFIFKGTIRILHTSTTDAPDAEQLGVVKVSEIYESPEVLSNVSGKEITVRFNDVNSVSAGEEYIFFTNLHSVGEEVSVNEVGRLRPEASKENDIRAQIAETKQANDEAKIKQHIARSELIVEGTVVNTMRMARARELDTEHDPEWTEAEVQIEKTLKGNADKTVRVVYAASVDVAWWDKPKLEKGMKALFLLRRNQTFEELKGRFAILEKEDRITDNARIEKVTRMIGR